MPPIRILITDDHQLYRGGVCKSLAVYKDIEIIAEAANGQELLDKLEYLRPHIVITGINMPVMDGLTALRHIKQKYPYVKVIILSMTGEANTIREAVELGANAYLLKSADPEEIYEAIIYCHKNWLYITPVLATAIMQSYPHLEPYAERPFNSMELDILQLLHDKKPVAEIALHFNLSPRTIAAIINRMQMRAGTRSIAGLLMYAEKEKLLEE